MTDDRARRIRDLRNQRSGDDTDDEEAGVAEDDGEAPDGDEQHSSADRATATDGNGEAADSSGGSDATDGESDTGATDDESDTDADPDIDGNESTIGDTADTSDDTADTSDDTADTSDDTADTSDDDADSSRSDDTTSSNDSPAESPAGDELTYDESAVAAEQSDQSAAEGSAVLAAESTSGISDDAGASPMVDTQDRSTESPFGGAIADASVMSEFVDDVGTESTADAGAAMGDDGYGSGTSEQGGDVLDRSDDLVASAHDNDTIQMLEFHLNDNRYAVEIEQISAIVEMKEITRFPRGPEAIDGVTDLRGEITAVLDPTAMLDVERNELTDDQYIVVLERDDDKQKLGVRVTDVSQAVTYRTSQIDEAASVMDSSEEYEFINGIVKKSADDRTELVTWIDTGQLIENTG